MNDSRTQLPYDGFKRKLTEFDALKVEMDKFLEDIDQKLTNKQAEFSHEAHIHKQITSELKSIDDDSRKKVSSLSAKELSVKQRLDEAMANLEIQGTKVRELEQDKNEFLETKKQLEAEIKRLNELIDRNRDELRSSDDAFEQRLQSCIGEALKYELFSGMRLEPLDNNQIQFIFFNLDPNDPDRKFSVVVDVGGESFLVGETLPQLSREFLDNAQLELNQHQQLARFLKQVWSQFNSLVSS
ncbi:SPC25 [Candida margitis]|uniref:SPC25 n=1 Tax=Candida margitis TaxID=1775924 RepID=UPI0022260506|nr:SPC25 [Candida margitis]KAI5969902.1 SPC25 [Candida margitis]